MSKCNNRYRVVREEARTKELSCHGLGVRGGGMFADLEDD
jgi:hypothetical protein